MTCAAHKAASAAGKALSDLGSSKGGKARAAKISAARRSEIAQLGATTRWKDHIRKPKKGTP